MSFTATPAAGYYFVAWALNGSYLSTGIPANNPDTWVMNASYALTAYFQAESYPMGQNQWVRYSGNPVLTTSTHSWDDTIVYDPKPFLFPNGTFGMAYFACCTEYGIGLATSSDGRTWTKVNNVTNNGPILERGTAGQWDNTTLRPGSIFYDSSRSQYLLYYSARNHVIDGVTNIKCGIGVSYSSDAINWHKSSYPIINTNGSCHGLSSPSVIKVGSTYTMWYGEYGAVKIATSITADANWDNGTHNNNGGAPVLTPACYSYSGPGTWCYGADPVLAPGPWDSDYVYAPIVVYDPAANNFKMFYSGQDGNGESPFTNAYGAVDPTGYATSHDGVTWTRYPKNPIIAPVPGGWDNGDATDSVGVLPYNGQLFVYYSGDTFTTETCLESGSSSAHGTGTCPVSNNPWYAPSPSHFVTLSIGLLYISEIPSTYHLWVTVEPTGAGTVTLNPAGTACTPPAGVTKCVTYTTALTPPYGPTVSFTATPASGYYFVAWALNGSYLATGIPANNPDTWVMNASYALTAYFQAQNQWVRYQGNPVLTANPTPSAWDNNEVWIPRPFIFPNGTFGMAYYGCCNQAAIGLATSPDGTTWTRVNNVTNGGPILMRGGPGQWDNSSVTVGSIFYDTSRSQYLLYYSGRNHVIDGVSEVQCGIGVAYSSDAINWYKSSYNPIFQTAPAILTGSGSCQDNPSVVKVGGTYMMWYGRKGAVRLATSSNAETNWRGSPNLDSNLNPRVFTPTCYSYHNPGPWCYGADPVLTPGPWDSDFIYSPSVVYDPAANNFKMFYSGCDGNAESPFTNYSCALFLTGFATSPDGVNWTRDPGSPIISPVPGGWENGDSTDNAGVMLYKGQLFVYYSGDTFTNQTCLESGSSSAPGTGTCPLSNNPFPGVPSHFLTYSIGGTYIIPPSSLSGELSITGDSPIDVLVTDPLGRVVGGNTTNTFNEIPGATYSGLGTEPQKITIPNPIPGAYSIKVFGRGVGPFHMKLQTISDVGTVVGTQVFTGQASVGSNSSFTPGLDPSGVVTPDGYGIKLSAGWNLVSLPLVPLNTKISNVLSGLIAAKDFTIVWAYQGGKWSSASLSNGKLSGPLTTMQDGVGYWIYMTKADTLNVNGYVIPPAGSPPSYSLLAGWNLIGFKPQPTVAPEPVNTYLTSISGNYNSVWLYDNTSQSWIRANSPYMVEPGQAMWVLMTASATLRP